MDENNSSLDDFNEEVVKKKNQRVSSAQPKKELKKELKSELKKELMEELKEELKEELMEELKEDLKEETKKETKKETNKETKEKTKEETKEEIKEEKSNNTETIETSSIKVNLPTQLVEIVKLTKSGSITIPKKVREKLSENQIFACWEQELKIIFQPIKEFQIQELNLVKAKSGTAKDPANKTKRSKKNKKVKKKTEGPQPELIKYIPFQIDNQDKILSILESTFYIMTDEPPKIDEGIERIRYIIINYTSGIARNDDRLKNTVILFISDIIDKISAQNFNELIKFAKESIVSSIKSTFLREQALITLFVTSIRANIEDAELFLKEILQGILEYTEPYAILQGFKGLVRSISKGELNMSDSLKFLIRDEIQKFIIGYETPQKKLIEKEVGELSEGEVGELSEGEVGELSEEEIEELSEGEVRELSDEEVGELTEEEVIEGRKIEQLNTDHSLQLIELLEDLHLVEDAYHLTENLLKNISLEDIKIEVVRQTLKRLKNTHI